MEGMEDYDGDPTDWDEKGQDGQLSRNIQSLEVALRCPICQGIMKTAVSLPCGHGFCSTCIRAYMEGRPDECPTCKANKAPPIGRPIAVVRVDRALNDAVEAFRALRPRLLSLLESAGAKPNAESDDEEVSILSSTLGSRKRVRRRSSKGMQQDEDEEWSDSDDGKSKSSIQRRPNSRGGQWWEEKGISKIKYHHATDAMIKRQLEVMGLSTHGGKEKLVLRHSMYMREVDAARDQALLDAKHVKPKSQVIREINVFEKKRDEEATRSSKRLKPSSSGSLGGSGSSRLPVARERMFDELTTQLQRRMKEQKAAKAQQSKAPQGEAAQGGGQAAGPSMASRGEGARAREGGDPFHFNEEQASAIEARYGSMNGKLPEARSSGTLQDEEEEEIVYMNGDLPTHDLAEGQSGSPDSVSKVPPAAADQMTSPPTSRPQTNTNDSSEGNSQGDFIDLVEESEEGEGEEGAGDDEHRSKKPSPAANGKRKSFGLKLVVGRPRHSGMGVDSLNRIDVAHRGAPGVKGRTPTPPPAHKPWHCDYCTLLNTLDRETCDACGSHRVRSTGHRVQEDQLRILKEATKTTQRASPRTSLGSLSALKEKDR